MNNDGNSMYNSFPYAENLASKWLKQLAGYEASGKQGDECRPSAEDSSC